ncbi:hypothetical protein Fcan01_26438 [Folsomia candida]|uniref:F-box domain-containing protein n=1 Tax=Folsomia candida TaxID=158441 RepID=A0A226CZY5_FOLCA|nr:hypothetical protein Fcan01_26438 [Folsomia candida]
MSLSYSNNEVGVSQSRPAILIPNVISSLCKFLSVKDIKECRLVSQVWNQSATPVLKARTRMDIELCQDNGWGGIIEKLKFSPVHVSLEVKDESIPSPDPEVPFPLMENLKSLWLNCEGGNQPGKDFCHKIILTSAPILQELELECSNDPDVPALQPGTLFPKLKDLGISYWWELEDDAAEKVAQIITACPALECLRTYYSYLDGFGRMKLLQKLPPSFSSLTLDGDLNADGLEVLLKIPSPLKKLTFEIQYDAELQKGDYLQENLYKLLHKHSPTLEKLSISFPSAFDKIMEWKFPVFSAMKVFQIQMGMNNKISFQSRRGKFGWIDYHKSFPVLESLHVCSDSVFPGFSSVDQFLPKGSGGSESVKRVEMVVSYDAKREANMAARTDLYDRLVKTFPNGRDSVRKSS